MKQRLSFFLFLAAVLAGAVFIYSSKPAAPSQTQQKVSVPHDESPLTPPSKELSPAEARTAAQSLKKMSTLLFQNSVAGKKMEDFVKELKESAQEPFLVRDRNEETGDMIIVRTKSPLPGTRYLHAQYFTDENQHTFAQHLSFEYRASPQAMVQAIQTVQEIFPHLDQPAYETRDFIQWDLEDGYVIWIKRLGPEDIQENPFNFYSAADIGSIRIAVELAPEAD